MCFSFPCETYQICRPSDPSQTDCPAGLSAIEGVNEAWRGDGEMCDDSGLGRPKELTRGVRRRSSSWNVDARPTGDAANEIERELGDAARLPQPSSKLRSKSSALACDGGRERRLEGPSSCWLRLP